MTAFTWTRHELPPWERQRSNTAVYGVQLAHPTPGAESWIIIDRAKLRKGRKLIWAVTWYPAGLRGLHPHICVGLFGTRTLKAAKQLAELWAATRGRADA